jgi:hypothetical protein
MLRRAFPAVLQGGTALWPCLAVGAVIAVASYSVGPTRGDLEADVDLASMATFLFGVLVAFTIARTNERLAVVQGLVGRGNAYLLFIRQMGRPCWSCCSESSTSCVRGPNARPPGSRRPFLLSGHVRVVDYPDPYANRSTTIVTLEDLAGDSPSSVTLQVEAGRVGDG